MTGHVHGGGPEPRASRRVRVVLAALVVPALLVTVLGAWWLWPDRDALPVLKTTAPGTTFERVLVMSIDLAPDAPPETQVVGELADGSSTPVLVPPEYVPEVEPGDVLTVLYLAEAVGEGSPYVFVDFVRDAPIGMLAAVFAVLVLAVARWRGLAALVGLVVSFAGIAWFTLPALLEGRPAVPVALVTASALMFVLLYLAHGVTARTTTALLGTFGGLAATALLAGWASGAAHLTGLVDENALDLRQYAPDVSLSGVLLCGIVVAGLGVLNDVTITQASAVWELRASAPHASRRELYARGMRIGRDHIASTVYTVAFAYVGAALPLVLLVSLSDRALLGTLTSGEIAEEVVRTLVGSIGLVLAIPVTTAVAALVVGGPARAARDATGGADEQDGADEPGGDDAQDGAVGPGGGDGQGSGDAPEPDAVSARARAGAPDDPAARDAAAGTP
ncbi:YibE/F family protein [Cellulomonas cellasea]|uniref:YibE/F family protein n=1 Tax=Cellulomonas cellasea TaxID=43670 RepID=UPI0009FBBF8A|nr:YibE/F family protein [Cellulomonas cellasea]